jgi:hypothetical protein
MTEFEIYSLWLGIVGIFLVVPGLVFAGYQIYQSTLIQRENHAWNMKVSAQQAVAATHEVDFKMQLETELPFIRTSERLSIEVIHKKLDDKPELVAILHRLLNVYESYARGIDQKIYDEEVIKDSRGIVMIKMYDVFIEYVEFRRQQDHPAIWDKFEKMTNKWRVEDNF